MNPTDTIELNNLPELKNIQIRRVKIKLTHGIQSSLKYLNLKDN